MPGSSQKAATIIITARWTWIFDVLVPTVTDRSATARAYRREVLLALAALAASPVAHASEDDEGEKLVRQITGKTPIDSDRVRLQMPKVFPNGYTVPLSVQVESPMTQVDHVQSIRVLAPRNPLVEVATFRFTPSHSVAHVSTRVRLAAPQFVLAVAEMNDGALLIAKTWVDVATDGCK